MQLIVNGEHKILPDTCNLADALEKWGYQKEMPIAVAVNNQFIPKQDYLSIILSVGNVIEILMPMQGG